FIVAASDGSGETVIRRASFIRARFQIIEENRIVGTIRSASLLRNAYVIDLTSPRSPSFTTNGGITDERQNGRLYRSIRAPSSCPIRHMATRTTAAFASSPQCRTRRDGKGRGGHPGSRNSRASRRPAAGRLSRH